MKTTDVDFLIEYRRVLQPLASTLDALQGQNDCFYGIILPKLIQLRHSVAQIQKTNLVYCDPLASALLNGLQARHGSLLELQMPLARNAAMAAISHHNSSCGGCHQLSENRFVPPLSSNSNASNNNLIIPFRGNCAFLKRSIRTCYETCVS